MTYRNVLRCAAIGLLCMAGVVSAQSLGTVRFHEYPGSIAHIGSWAMVEHGFCEKHNIKCERVLLPNGPLAQQAAAAGGVDIINSSADVMMQAVSRGHSLQIIGTLASNNVYSLAVRADLPDTADGYPENVQALKDVRNLKIGVTARGSATEMYARALLDGAGVSPDTATYVAVGAPNTAYAALVAKQVDAILSWDPIPAMCVATGNCRVLVDLRKGEGPAALTAMNGGFVVWQATSDFVQKNQAKVDAFLSAYAEAVAWVKDPKNRAEVEALVRKNFKPGDVPNQQAFMEQLLNETLALIGSSFDPGVIDGFNQFLMRWKLIEKPLPVEAIVYEKAR